MKKIIFPLLLLAGGASYYFLIFLKPVPPVFQLEEGYRYLYDGQSLAGWRVIGGQSTFEADGESILGRHGPGGNTFLRTEEDYANFSLKMQMRWDEPGNSGVLFRAHQREGDGRAYGYQFKLDDSDRSWSGAIYDEARRGWLANLENRPDARDAIGRHDWNDIEIEARGTRLKTWINGVAAADIVDGLDAEGFIALQVHAGGAGVMRWRHIRIKELPGSAQVGHSLMAASEWRMDNPGELDFAADSIGGALPVGEFWITPRRQFSDAMVSMTVPACDTPTTIRMRYLGQDAQSSFAEVKVYSDRAEARLVTPAGEQVVEPVRLEPAERHRFVGVTSGGSVTLSVDDRDAMRLDNTGLAERGQLRIQPARCGDRFQLTALDWYSLKEETSSEPLFYQTLDNRPAPVLSPQEALEAFRVAPGFEVELVAAEPLVEEPVAMAWDEYGRLYVVEMRGYMRDAYGTDSDLPVGQIVRLEDTNADGRMDTSEVFLGGLVNPRAVAVVNEGILIGEPPNLWLCEVPARDSRCQNKQRIGAYATDDETANVEHMENALMQGLDNWLYNAKSSRSLRIEDGELIEREGLFRGQWGITRDDVGRLLYNHNSTWIQADLFAAEDFIQPDDEGYHQGLGVNLTNPSKVYSVRVNPGVNRAYLSGTLREDGRLNDATGVSGLVSYRGDQFPGEYHSDVFVPEVAGNVVAQFDMSEEGLALKATQRLYDDEQWGKRDFLGSTDERFRPVDAMNGPDGALYIIDMYRGIVQDDYYLTDELREQVFQRELEAPIGMGRIWRVRHSEGKSERDFPALAGASAGQLVAALRHSNGWVRDTAQRLLLDQGGNLTAALGAIASGDDTIAALHAIWALQGRGELQHDLVMQLALFGDPQRQIQALRAGHSFLSATDLVVLSKDLKDSPEAVSMQLAFAMADHASDVRVRGALSALLTADLASPYVRQAVLRALAGQELLFLRESLAAGNLETASDPAKAVLGALASGAYRSLRGDITSGDSANPALLELLSVAESRRNATAWQQIAMLEGMGSVALSTDFVPAMLDAPPPIFSDSSISDQEPLWKARLSGRAAFTWPGDELALGITPLSPEQLELMALGERFYAQCGACHSADGAGIAGLAPPLAGSTWVTGPPEWLARIILQGLTGPVEVTGEMWNGVMPPHGHLPELDDKTLAGLMIYLRRGWGNKAAPVSVATAADIRAASSSRNLPWTVAELRSVPYDRGFKRFVGVYAISFVTLTVTEEPEGLALEVPMYGAGVMEQLNATTFRAAAGDEDVKIEFVVDNDGAVNSMLMHRKGEKISIQRK